MQNVRKPINNHQNYHNLDRLSKPYLIWLYILALFPMIIMLGLTFVQSEGVSLDGMSLTFQNFADLFEVSIGVAFWNSIRFSILTTIICLFFGYIVAYRLFKSKFKNKSLILMLLILPMWTNILLRTEALGNIMQENNMITNMLGITGINIIGSDFAVLVGLVFTYLPFVILPIYTALEKIDPSLEQAALDLGVTEVTKFWKVIFPLSIKGMVSGSIMVLLPCLSGFAIPKILGQGNILLIGNIIEQNFSNMNYNLGALLAVIILIVILSAILLVNKVDKEGETLL